MQTEKLADVSKLSLSHTLLCGQCFRWEREPDGAFFGVVDGFPARVEEKNGVIYINAEGEIDFWRSYFDIERNYEHITQKFPQHHFTQAALKFGKGLRVLRQNPWEMLCSYVISQNNNIPKIRSSILKMCQNWGDAKEFHGKAFHSFPRPEQLTHLKPSDFNKIGIGYRDKYLHATKEAVLNGKLDFEELKMLPTNEGREKLLSIFGIGPKVANCVLLFGFGKFDALPEDKWIKEASAKYYDGNLAKESFGNYAGIAQQYIFHYIRNGRDKKQ
ncbi:MAG: DNA-3-methyladenine glycosylase family protein [Thermoguttaceae bacterium]